MEGQIVWAVCSFFSDFIELYVIFMYNTNIKLDICVYPYLGGIYMKGYIDGDLGRISIDSEVIARYAGSTAVECFGIVGMAAVSMKDGLFKLLKGDSLTRGINVKIDEDNKISIEFHVIVSYGVSILTVADNLIENVKYKVHEFTGLEIKKIDIYVEGVRVID